MVSRRGLLSGAALVGVGAIAGVAQGAGVAVADTPNVYLKGSTAKLTRGLPDDPATGWPAPAARPS
ncbi:hypothetical protein [Streptomyces sp. NPDC051642]|uniref:hypothetical protein n=1 Tax=unclassified Streptomyces TaxID=2593676 RepID=UPI0034172BE0